MGTTMRALALAAICAAAPAPAQTVARSVPVLPSSNGHGALVYDVAARQLREFWPAIYKTTAPGQPVPDLLYDAYVGVRLAGRVTWLRDVPADEVGYEPGTNIIRVLQRLDGRAITTWWWAPWAWEAPAFAFWVNVQGAAPDDAIVSLANLQLGRETGAGFVGAEETRPEPGDAVREAGERATVLHLPLRPPSGIAAPPENPFRLAQEGRAFPPPPIELRVSDDAAVGFQWEGVADGRLEGGAVVGVRPAGELPAVSLDRERRDWADWMAALRLPAEDDLTRQQAAFLRQGQVRTPGRGRGQILASLPPGMWNISWVRDMAYSVAALARVGALDEAWNAIAFQLNADAGYYEQYVGRPYLISVTRYFGDGREESDSNEHGPNIEWDDFGLFLWSVGRWVEAGGDVERLRPEWPRIRRGVLEVVESLVDPELGLLVPDSSIWERHWEGGNLDDGLRQRFAFSTIVNAAGLCRAAAVAERLGEDGDRWRALAWRLRDAVERHLVDADGVVAASYEQLQRGSGYLDLAVVEAFTLGLLPVDGREARASWAAFDRRLRIAPDRGFKRNDDGENRPNGDSWAPGWYDEQEWVFIDLRTEIWRRAANLPGADLLADVRRRAEANYGIIPELLAHGDARFEGALPMMGFGAGAWLLALADGPESFCERPAGSQPDAGPPPDAGDASAPDASTQAPDSATDFGRPSPDAGAGAADASSGLPPPQDASFLPVDGGADAARAEDGGGDSGCAAVGSRGGWLAALALLALRRRRRGEA